MSANWQPSGLRVKLHLSDHTAFLEDQIMNFHNDQSMVPAREFPPSSLRTIFDLNAIGNIVPLKRLSSNDLRLQLYSAPHSWAARNISLILLLVFTVQKIYSFFQRTVYDEISAHQIFHSSILPHVSTGFVCTIALAT